ncbi:hypothetical protein H098_08025 [Pseudomonas fluorescens FH5]|nr:hypothetical protein H098_08025 [Pseudomonas fluorescens FH5]
MGDNSFGAALRKLRLARGLSQQDFTDVVSREHISRLERGVSQPNLEVVEGLAAVLSVHPLSLVALSYQEAVNPPTPLSELMKVIEQDLRDV